MKIISQFKDYYDVTLSMGSDSRSVYIRKTEIDDVSTNEELAFKAAKLFEDPSNQNSFVNNCIELYNSKFSKNMWAYDSSFHKLITSKRYAEAFLVVAGKPYSIYLCEKVIEDFSEKESGDYKYHPTSKNHDIDKRFNQAFFSKEDLLDAAKQHISKKETIDYFFKYSDECGTMQKDKDYFSNISFAVKDSKEIPDSFFSKKKSSSSTYSAEKIKNSDFTELCTLAQTPIILIVKNQKKPAPDWLDRPKTAKNSKLSREEMRLAEQVSVIKNPPLKDLGLAGIMPAFEMFQTCDQFISGVLPGATSPMVEIKDKDMIVKKGFDPTYGFRKRPEKK